MDQQLPTQPNARPNPIQAMFAQMDRRQRRNYLKEWYKSCHKYPDHMVKEELPPEMQMVIGVWRSRDFSCMAWKSEHPQVLCRLSINRMQLDENTGAWLPGISWDQLYQIKNQCGFGDKDAVEIYPSEDKLINVSNMRHLWIMLNPMPFGLSS